MPVSARLVRDINQVAPIVIGSAPANFATIGAITYFSADDGSNGRELWKTDGTAAGTALVRDLVAGGGAVNGPLSLTNIGNHLVGLTTQAFYSF